MKVRPNFGLALSLGLVLGITISLGHGVLADRDKPNSAVPLEELRVFSDVYARIKKDYVEDVSDKKLLENAIQGMLSGLDPHSAYLNSDDFRELQIGTSGEFGGLGIEVGMEDGFVKVISPIDGTPAQRAGVKAGDLIIRLNETPVKGLSLNDAVQLMRGKKGTDIVLTIVREGDDKPMQITVTRDVIRVRSVRSETLEPDYGYIRISNFQSDTADSMLTAIKKLKADNGGKLSGLVLDLRNNPGGVLTGAVGVSDAFLEEKKLIVYTEGRAEDSELRYTANSADSLNGTPIVTLINGGSASASEIVAGALQDHKRSVIMGTKSFGKGSVQTILPLQEDTALKLTTARYFTPSGRSIQNEGIIPDIEIKNLTLTDNETSGALDLLTEADLTGHLENPKLKDKNAADSATKKPQDLALPSDTASLASTDYQLSEALNLLKGIHILSQKN